MNNSVFIVGTGRCGSTLLSNIINSHPELLSLSEFFSFITDLGTLIPEAFADYPICAEQFWNLLATCYPKQNLMQQKNICMDEVLYRATENSYFSLAQGVPAIMQTTLPHLASNPILIFEELKTFILSLPNADISAFYRQTFCWLAQKTGKNFWIERSGGSLRIVHRLYKAFPEAKFIHIVRDGRTTALSMEKHYGFRMVLIVFQLIEILGIDPFRDNNRDFINDLPDEIANFLPENFDARAFRHYKVGPSLFGYYWSGEIVEGLKEMAAIPEQQKLTIQYENILNHPVASIECIAQFITSTTPDKTWVEQCAAMIKKPTSSFSQLSVDEQKKLEKACQSGFDVLKKHGIAYF